MRRCGGSGWCELPHRQKHRPADRDGHHHDRRYERPNISAASFRELREACVDRRELYLHLGELFFDLGETLVHLRVDLGETGLCLEVEVCEVAFGGQLFPSSGWLLCHEELRFLWTNCVCEIAVDFGSLLLCEGHCGVSGLIRVPLIQGGSGLPQP